MNKMKQLLLGLAVVVGISAMQVASAAAVNVFKPCEGNADSAVCKSAAGETQDSASGMITIVINTLLFVLGIISVIMIVIGGIRYTTSGGDPSGLKTARDTIIYSVVGLVVAIMAYAIVNFVVGRFLE